MYSSMLRMRSPHQIVQLALMMTTLLRTTGVSSTSPQGSTQDMQRKFITQPAHVDLQLRATQYFTDYQWLLELSDRRRGVTYTGANTRLRVLMDKWLVGKQNIKVATVGSSITALQGVDNAANGYPNRVGDMLRSSFPNAGKVEVVNGAVPGTVSMFMSVCLQAHVPQDVDLVVVDYSANDPVNAAFGSDIRKGFERLLRKLLNYPRQPAVLLLHNYMWSIAKGMYWGNAEGAFYEYATYYGIPQVSVKAACHRHWVANDDGFWVNTTRREYLNDTDAFNAMRGRVFFYDPFHPDGHSGHRAISELLFHLVNTTARDIERLPVTDVERQLAAQPLRSPMAAGNFETTEDRCLVSTAFQQHLHNSSGFQWTDENRGKWGYVGEQPGAYIILNVSTEASSVRMLRSSDGRVEVADRSGGVLVEIAYLKSYKQMGIANISCVSGCTCETTVVDSHGDSKSSQTHLHTFTASQHKQCLIKVEVAKDSSTGGHKVKVLGIIVSEQAGATHSIQNSLALEAFTMKQGGGTHSWGA